MDLAEGEVISIGMKEMRLYSIPHQIENHEWDETTKIVLIIKLTIKKD